MPLKNLFQTFIHRYARLTILAKGLLLVAVPTLIQLLLIVLITATGRRERDADRSVAHAQAVLLQADRVLSRLLDAETGCRGYVLTGNPEFIEPYGQVEQELPQRLNALNALVSDSPKQRAAVEMIAIHAARWLEFQVENVRLVREGARDEATARIASRVGKQQMDDLRREVAAFQRDMERLSAEKSDLRERNHSAFQEIILIGTGLSLLLAVLSAVLFTHGISTRVGTLIANIQRLSQGQELTPPVGGSDEIATVDQAFRDMAQKLAQSREELAQHTRVLHSMLDSMGDGVVVADEAGKFLVFNRAAEQIIGVGSTDGAPREWSERYHVYLPDQTTLYPPRQLPLARAMRGEEVDAAELFIRNPAQSEGVWVTVNARPLKDAHGLARGGVAVLQDVTQGKRAEQERDKFFDLSLDILGIAQADGYFKRINPAFSRMLGWSDEEILTRPFIDFVHPDDRAATLREVERQVVAGEPVLHFENRYQHKDGSWRVLSWKSVPQPGGFMYATARDVTDAKRGEEALRRSEQNLAITLDSIGDAVMATDTARRITRMNPVAEQMTGWTQSEALGRPIDAVFHILHEETRRTAVIPVDNVLATGVVHGLTNHSVLISRDGTERPIANSAAPICDNAGQITGVVLVFRDVADERRFEQALQRLNADLERRVEERTAALNDSEKRFRLLVEHAADGIFISDVQGFFQDVNSSGCAMLGYTRDELLRLNVRQIVDPEDPPRVAPEFAPVAAADQPYLREWRGRRKDGTTFVGEVNGRALPDGRLLAMVRDVTERKRAEQREQNQSRIYQSLASGESLEQTLEVIAHAVEAEDPAALCSILLLDASGQCLWQGAAPSLPRFYNEAIHGVRIGVGVGCCGTAAFNQQRVIAEDILTHPYWINYRELAAKAGLRSCWSEPILSLDGHTLGTFAIYHREPRVALSEDVKRIQWAACFARIAIERRQMESLARDKYVAESASQAKSDFLASMSHELRTPLNGILGMNELLLNTELTERQRQFVQAGTTSGKALLQQVNDILDLSKIEAGKLELDLHECRLEALVFDVVEVFVHIARQKGYPLHCHFDPAACMKVVCDDNRIRQILVNLLGNAIKFTKTGEVILRAECKNWLFDELTVRFSVTDTGRGIPEDRRNRLFAPFSQVDSTTAREFGGTGLGLSICKQLVELMGGHIGVESQLGVGSTFWFEVTLPIVAEDSAVSTRQHPVTGKRVLVINGADSNRLQVVDFLDAWGFQTEHVTAMQNALQAVALAESAGAPFSAVLVDCQLVAGDGYVLLQKLAEHPCPPVIGVGTNQDDKAIASLQQLGVRHVLHAPVRPSSLFNALTSVLATKSPAAFPNQKPDAAADEPPTMFSGHILVAEDNKINQMFVSELLKHCGCTSDIADNGDEALTALQQKCYDLILMDCQMPEMDGFTASREIRRRETVGELPGRLPIIALTANALHGDRERCLNAGMDDYLSKPLQAAQLQALLAKYLAQPSTDGNR